MAGPLWSATPPGRNPVPGAVPRRTSRTDARTDAYTCRISSISQR
ncbi:hypothetical protein SGPA1_50804 [Streptomyces misionensis JCM 4497]